MTITMKRIALFLSLVAETPSTQERRTMSTEFDILPETQYFRSGSETQGQFIGPEWSQPEVPHGLLIAMANGAGCPNANRGGTLWSLPDLTDPYQIAASC